MDLKLYVPGDIRKRYKETHSVHSVKFRHLTPDAQIALRCAGEAVLHSPHASYEIIYAPDSPKVVASIVFLCVISGLAGTTFVLSALKWIWG
jgi:hypothetical protein